MSFSLFFHKDRIQLSSSRLSSYINCPFKYAAEKLFFCREKTFVGRELSALAKGLIAHKLFEDVLTKHPDLSCSEEDMENIIEERKPEDKEFIHSKQWLVVKENLKSLLRSFLEREQADRRQFPDLRPKAFERKISAYWDQKKGELSFEGDYLFQARIDRIDQHEATHSYVIRDYKASKTGLNHITRWIKREGEEFQLTFYAQALQKGVGGKSSGRTGLLFVFFCLQ